MTWNALVDWFMGLGREYGVNPIVFGIIYIGAIPFFTLSVAWIVRNVRKKRSIVLPALSASFFFISAYLYLLVAGRGVPVWVYAVIAVMIGAGVVSTVNKIRRRIRAQEKPENKKDYV
ncbi:MAG: hypothetical protein WD021_01470 [Rhodothermales bacterium]